MGVLAAGDVLVVDLVSCGGHAHGAGVFGVVAGKKSLAHGHVSTEGAVFLKYDDACPGFDGLPGGGPTGAPAAHHDDVGLVVPDGGGLVGQGGGGEGPRGKRGAAGNNAAAAEGVGGVLHRFPFHRAKAFPWLP